MKVIIKNVPAHDHTCLFKDGVAKCRFFDPYEIRCVLFEISLKRKARMGYPHHPFKCDECAKINGIKPRSALPIS